jgi:hypothetical protein
MASLPLDGDAASLLGVPSSFGDLADTCRVGHQILPVHKSTY